MLNNSAKGMREDWNFPGRTYYPATAVPLRLAVSTALLVCAAVPLFGSGSEEPQKPREGTETLLGAFARTRGPYCGLYSVCGALRAVGTDVDFEELLEPQYISSREGSSLADLKRAVEDNGAYAVPMTGLTSEALRGSPYPVILHVTAPRGERSYKHWVLFLGVEHGKARVLDVPSRLRLVPFADLLAQWDNTALVVSREPVKTQRLFWCGRSGFLPFVAVVLAAVAVLACLARRSARLDALATRRSSVITIACRQAGAILVTSVLVGLGWHAMHDEGILRNRRAVASVAKSHFPPSFRRLETKDVARLLEIEEVTLVDARFPKDYEAGHLPGAINIPVNVTTDQLEQELARISAKSQVVVYCQSAECGFATEIGTELAFSGFDNVALFPGGWKEWEGYHRPKD